MKATAPKRFAPWQSAAQRCAIVFLVLFTAAGMWWKWGKLNSLLWIDPAWWLNEYGRYARGEIPYRDFYWPYGPLSADVFAWPMRLFGLRFAVVQIVIDILSLLVVFLVYKVARRLVPAPLGELIAIWLIAVGITARTFFSLFSLISYTPAVHVGAIGMLLTLWAILAYIDDGRPRNLWIAAGAWIALLSKHETALATVAVLVILFVFDRNLHFKELTTTAWLRKYALLLLTCFAVPAIVYCGWAVVAGWSKFVACIQGFGLAGMTCPWWPTGFGVVGGLVEIGEAWIILAVASIFVPAWRARLGGRYFLVWLGAAAAAVAAVTFEWRLISDLLFGHASFSQRAQNDFAELLSTSAILRPVLWACYIYGAILVILAVRNSITLSAAQLRDVILIAIPCVMGMRSLFGSMLGLDMLEVPAASYPFLLLTGPYLLYAMLARHRKLDSRAIAFCAAIMIAYSIIRVGGGYSSMLSDASFGVIQTDAGPIRLTNSATEKPVLDYVLAHTKASDTILELPFGGGMSFATGRRQPTYSTLFTQLRPPAAIQEEDLRRIAAHPPEVVIAWPGTTLGTLYGYPGTLGCVFPRLVWQPDVPTADPNYLFPAIAYIERNYRVDRTVGRWLLLRPVDHPN